MLHFPPSMEELEGRARSLDGLQIALRTQPHSFVSRFLEADGLGCLLNLLAGMDWDTVAPILEEMTVEEVQEAVASPEALVKLVAAGAKDRAKKRRTAWPLA